MITPRPARVELDADGKAFVSRFVVHVALLSRTDAYRQALLVVLEASLREAMVAAAEARSAAWRRVYALVLRLVDERSTRMLPRRSLAFVRAFLRENADLR